MNLFIVVDNLIIRFLFSDVPIIFNRKNKSNQNSFFFFLLLLFNRLENEWINDESEKLFARFITLLGDFTYAGFNDIKLSARPETIIDIPSFTMPQPKKTGREKKKDYFFHLNFIF